jgi:uncharacterized protein (TIGR00299 family) protein
MARVMYLDCFSGAAGDMLLGAFLDAGLPVDALKTALGTLGIGHELAVTRVLRAGLSATHVDVIATEAQSRKPAAVGQTHAHPHGPASAHGPETHHTLAEIAALIERSSLSAAAKARAVALFRRLAEAEAAIHDTALDQVHLHEVGAVDSIIDICGVVFAFEWFGIDDVVASPLNLGGGSVQMTHGRYPVPAPATLRLLAGIPVSSSGIQSELVTPTGALLVSDYAKSYGVFPAMTVETIGYGAGTKDFQSRPNVLRVVIGERTAATADAGAPAGGEVVTKIECEIDDMSPQLFGAVTERLLAAGAVDVFLTAVQMKKGRPGTLLTVLARSADRRALIDLLFRETTTIGVRFEEMRREVLERRWEEVQVTGGTVRMKIAGRGGDVLTATPEFDDCLRVAAATGQPVKAVQAEAMRAWAR